MNLYNPPAGTIRASLRYPAFRRLLSGLAVSQTGDWLYNLALVTMVYEGTHSAMWVGITTAARVVPLVALGPLGGVIADRFDRRRLMAACDGIRLVLMLVLMLVLALVAVTHLPVLIAPVIAAAATAATAAGAPYLACASASIPRLVPDADPARRERGPLGGHEPGHHRRARARRRPAGRQPRPRLPGERGHLRPVRPFTTRGKS